MQPKCSAIDLDVIVILGQRARRSLSQFLLVSVHVIHVDHGLRGSHGGSLHEHKVVVSRELLRKPQEWLLEVVVGLGRKLEVLKVLLAMESDSLGLHLTVLNVDLVTAQHDGDVFAHAS